MTQTTNLKERAKQGETEALESLVNEWLSSKTVNVSVKPKQECLRITVESSPLSTPQSVVPTLEEKLRKLNPSGYKSVKVCGRETGEDFPEWYREFDLQPGFMTFSPELPNNVEAVFHKVTETAEGMLGNAPNPQKIASDIGNAANQASQTLLGNAPPNAQKVASDMGEAMGNAANQASKVMLETAVNVGDTVSEVTLKANKKIGSTFDWINQNPLARQVTKALPFNWLFIVDRVDISKATTEVDKLKREYPNDSANEIAHRIMVNKAMMTAGSGFVSSLVPGFAAALFAIDLAATMALQAELVYQIAYTYGFDINDENRKGEALAVLGLALGGGQALKIGGTFATRAGFLGLLRNIPFAGAAIGMSTNAAMTYTLGNAACRFYEAKKTPLTTDEEALSMSQEASEEYIQDAIAQETIMDSILVHVILADNPNKSHEQILQELEAFLSPASMEAISANMDSPTPLNELLNELNRDYALPLVVKCYNVAQLDGEIKPEAANVIDRITERFNIELDTLKAMSSEELYAQG